ncbi:MAG: CopG family transcriptional regulator [Candidatus Woesearchaeota archaeon]|nr:MAG: CopG family transcriptional regulator [Candidatus Woesearchaeota archaeon]
MKVEIDNEIIEKIKERIKDMDEFDSVEGYVDYILKQIVGRLEEENKIKVDKEEYSKEDEKKVKERLKSLGYLD